MSKLAVVRIRGKVDVREGVRNTLKMLRLTRPNHCTLVDEDSSRKGMLGKAKELLTWGVIDSEVLEKLLREKGELAGGEPVTDEVVEERSSYQGVEQFSKAVCAGDADLDEIEDLKKVFRLRPPQKGYSSTRRSFSHGGALGDRGEEINDLLLRMI